jgi:uncharacterized repeat protein (TIGR01451 family)
MRGNGVVGVRRVFTVASLAALALIAQGSGALALVPPSADLAITMTGPATATAGTNVTYVITITNNGPDPATGVAFNPVAPANTTYVSLNQTSGPPPSLTVPAGTTYVFSWVLTVNAGIPGGTVITNTVTISATTADPNLANNSATVLTTVGAAAQADLAVTKTADASALTGARFNSHIAVVNNGPQAASTVVVVDNLPAGLTGVTFATSGTSLGLSDGCANDLAGHINCHIAAMQLGQTFILDVSGIAAAPGDYTDTATASSATPDPNPANNSAGATTHVIARPVGEDGGGDHNSRNGAGQDNGQQGGDKGGNGNHGDKGSQNQQKDSSAQSHGK